METITHENNLSNTVSLLVFYRAQLYQWTLLAVECDSPAKSL